MEHDSGASGLESTPNPPFSTLNHGDRLPQCLNMSKEAFLEELSFDEKVGERRLGAPV